MVIACPLFNFVKAVISYDGFAFAGFQRQPHARSVQEEIEKTLTKLNKGQV